MARHALAEHREELLDAPRGSRVGAPRQLHLVKAPRRLRVGPTVIVLGLTFFALAVGVVFTQVLVVQRQAQLDQLEQQQQDATLLNQQLRLQMAQLESPTRVVEAATDLGMVNSAGVTYLHPDDTLTAPVVPDETTAHDSATSAEDNLDGYLQTRAALGSGG